MITPLGLTLSPEKTRVVSIQRLTEQWQAEHAAFRTRELRFHRYAYLFVDGVNVAVRLGEDSKLCLLVLIGVREDGEEELLDVEDGYRESEDSSELRAASISFSLMLAVERIPQRVTAAPVLAGGHSGPSFTGNRSESFTPNG